MVKKAKALEVLINDAFKKNEEIKALSKKIGVLKAEKDVIEKKLLAEMDSLGTDQSRSQIATATISEAVLPKVEDWEAFYKYISRNKAFYMLQRRPATEAYREALKLRRGKAVPGVTSFTRRTIGLRTR